MKEVTVYYADRLDKKGIRTRTANEIRIFLHPDSRMIYLMLQNLKEHIGQHIQVYFCFFEHGTNLTRCMFPNG